MASSGNRTAEVTLATGFGSKPKSEKKTNYWKKNSEKVPGSIKPVYSAMYSPADIPTHAQKMSSSRSPGKQKTKKGDSFANFDSNTSDVWDVDENEDLSFLTPQKRQGGHAPREVPSVKSHDSGTITSHNAGSDRIPSTSDSKIDHNISANVPLDDKKPGTSSPQLSSSPARVPAHQYEPPRPASPIRHTSQPPREPGEGRVEKFKELLFDTNTNLDELRKQSWNGIPDSVRPTAWKLLLGYLPANTDRREQTLQRKRSEYFGFVEQYYESRHESQHIDTFRQIHIDIPRTNPLIPMFQMVTVQEIFERILFIWAIRHPASGYVQGINDLVTPFFFVFLSEFAGEEVTKLDNFDLSKLKEENVKQIEADSFWCMSKLLDGIQDNYTFAQPGIQVKINSLKELIQRINAPLHEHLDSNQVEYLQFAFRWMNNLLMRELPLDGTIRLWDTYMSEPEGFSVFHLYVCAALLQKYAKNIVKEKDFQGIMLFLQNLPTKSWKNDDISLLLAEAYSLKYMFADAPRHLGQQKKR